MRGPSLISATDEVSPRLVWALAAPVLGQNLLAMLVGWSDTILTGQILVEDRYLAAITVCGYLLWLMESIGSLVWHGSHAIIARLIGANEQAEAEEIVLQSLLLAALLGVLLWLVVAVSADPVVGWMRLTGPSRELAVEYLHTVAVSGPFMMLMLVGTACLRAAGHTMAGMWIIVAVNVINALCSWTLTLGIGPIAPMGWRGIAVGTQISFIAGGVLTLAWLARGYSDLRLPRRRPIPDRHSFARILRIGVPGAANSLAVVLCQLWFISIIGELGDASIAAHGVAIRSESISWLTAEAFGIAGATLVGQSLGAGRPDLARRYGWATFRIGALALTLMGVGFYVAAPWLIAIFVRTEEAAVFAQAVPVLRLVAFAMPALAASIILTNALRGAGDTRWPLLYNSVGLLLVRIPLAYALTDGWVTLGLYGAWIAMLVDLYVRGAAALLRFLADGWTRIRI